MIVESFGKLFKNFKIINEDNNTITRFNEFEFAILDRYGCISDASLKEEILKAEMGYLGAFDINNKIIYFQTRKNPLYYEEEIMVIDLFNLLSTTKFTYLFCDEILEKEIKKVRLEFSIYINGEWYEEKFYCYPYIEYLESYETTEKIKFINETYVLEVSELVITEANEVILKINTLYEG